MFGLNARRKETDRKPPQKNRKGGRPPRNLRQTAQEMASAGVETDDIAAELGLKVGTVERMLSQAEEERPPRSLEEALDRAAIKYVQGNPPEVEQLMPDKIRKAMGLEPESDDEDDTSCQQERMPEPRRPYEDLRELASTITLLREMSEEWNPPRESSLLALLAPVVTEALRVLPYLAAQRAAAPASEGQAASIPATGPAVALPSEAAPSALSPPPGPSPPGWEAMVDRCIFLLYLDPQDAADRLLAFLDGEDAMNNPMVATVQQFLDEADVDQISALLISQRAHPKYGLHVEKLLTPEGKAWLQQALEAVREDEADEEPESEGSAASQEWQGSSVVP